jgi:hypothetical protein
MDPRANDGGDQINGEPVSHWHRPLGRRNVIAGIAGLGIAAGIGASQVLAQDATPTPSDETGGTTSGEQPDKAAEIGAAYQNFVGKLATNLGESDTAKVDTAIRDALKAMVDEQYNDGKISRNLADDLKSRIDSSDAPLAVAMLGGMGLRRVERRRDRRHDGQNDDDTQPGDDDTTEQPSTESTPSI